MQQALSGFSTIWLVIALGWVLGHVGIMDSRRRRNMSNFAFQVASPALLFMLVARGSLEHLFSQTLTASVLAIVTAGVTYLVVERLVFRRGAEARVIGTLCACYTNAGNLGLPIAMHLLGDSSWMAPIMLVQLGLLQPTALAILDARRAHRAGKRVTPLRYLSMPFRNPITVGILAGLVVALLRIPVPEWLASPISMVGGMAVPMMLVAFGVSLRLDPLPGRGPHLGELWTIQAIKVILMPVSAYLYGTLLGLTPPDVFAVTVIAALPTAQNVYVMSTRYDVRELLTRDAVFWSTVLSVPSILLISALLG